MKEKKGKRTRQILPLVIAAAALTLIVVLFYCRPWQPPETEDSSSNSLTTEEQRQLLMDSGMTEIQANSFIETKENVCQDHSALFSCEYLPSAKEYIVRTDELYLILMTAGNYTLTGNHSYHVSFSNDQIASMQDYNTIPVIEEGTLVEGYSPWTLEALQNAQSTLVKSAEPFMEDYYNHKRGNEKDSQSWLTIKELQMQKQEDQVYINGLYVTVDDRTLKLVTLVTVVPAVTEQDGKTTRGTVFIEGVFEETDQEHPVIIRFGETQDMLEAVTVKE